MDHAAVFNALCAAYPDLVSKNLGYRFAAIFSPQEPQCAHLYEPGAGRYRNSPLCLHPGKTSWRPDVHRRILPAIRQLGIQGNESRPPADRRILCEVADWDLLARALGVVRAG
jgi:hypothetical protein